MTKKKKNTTITGVDKRYLLNSKEKNSGGERGRLGLV